MGKSARVVALCCLVILAALYVVGAVSHGVLRHMVQTLPLWIPIALGLGRLDLAKWAAMPCMVFWLGIMVLIWLFLLHIARIVTGHYSPTEIAMTVVIGCACIAGLAVCARWRTSSTPLAATGVALLVAALQLVAFRVSLLPSIAHR